MCLPMLIIPALIITTLAKEVFPKYEAPKMGKAKWENVNAELKIEIAPLEFHISRANETNAAIS